MKNIRIGKKKSGAFTLPTDIQTVTSAVLGIRGSGKTNTATVCVEGLLSRNAQVVIIDPTDAWWGLRSSGDGKKAGHEIIIAGGEHGDVPLDESNGATLADFVVNNRVSMLLSLRHLRKGGQRRFVMSFAEQLYHRKGEAAHRDSILLVIDECDAFIPQRVGGAEARMVGAIEDLVRRGRSSGIGVMLISQRAASVNKDVLTQIEMLVAHRHTSPQDRKALEEWIKLNDTEGVQSEFLKSLAKLEMGEAWFWSPGMLGVFERVQVDKRKTFDSSATPKPGESITPPTKVAEIDMNALRDSLAETIREAEENDPKKLKAEIAKLRKEIDNREPVIDQAAIDAAVADATNRHRMEDARKREHLEAAAEQLREVAASLEALTVTDEPDEETRPVVTPSPAPRAVARAPRAATAVIADIELKPYHHDLLAVLLDRSPIPTPRAMLATLANKSKKSSAFAPRLRDLVNAGLATESDRGYLATDAAQAACPDYRPAPELGRAALDYWLSKHPAYESSLLRVLADAHPREMDKAGIGESAEKSTTSSAFAPALRNLVELGHVEKDGDYYKAADFFFDS